MAIPITIASFLIDKNIDVNKERKLQKEAEDNQRNLEIERETKQERILQEQVNKKEREIQAKKRELIEEEIPKFWATYNTHYQLNNSDPTNISREELSSETNDMLKSGIRILFKINALQGDFSKNSDSDDIDKYSELVIHFLSNYKQLITDDFPILNSLFDKFAEQTNDPEDQTKPSNVDLPKEIIKMLSNSNDINTSNVLIVRTLDVNGATDKIIGDWKMSSSKAKNIKYVIGVTGNAYGLKKYLKSVKVSGFVNVGDRIRFKTDDVLLDNTIKADKFTEKMSDRVSQLVSNWNAINPIVYMSHLEYLLFQHHTYKTFKDEFSQKINEYNKQSKDNALKIIKDFSKTTLPSFFRIRFRSKKLDAVLPDKFDEKKAYNDYSHWYEIISDNNLNTINFASVFFTNKATENNGDTNQIFDDPKINKFYMDKKSTSKPVTPFKADDENKNGYIIEVDTLPKSKVTDKESLNNFITNIFKAIEEDIKFCEGNAD